MEGSQPVTEAGTKALPGPFIKKYGGYFWNLRYSNDFLRHEIFGFLIR